MYLLENVSVRKAVCSFWFGMMDLYFREISIGGRHKILPINDGRAVIFACAPHVNQFVDPIVVMKVGMRECMHGLCPRASILVMCHGICEGQMRSFQSCRQCACSSTSSSRYVGRSHVASLVSIA